MLAELLEKKPFGLTTDIDGTLSRIVSVGPASVSPVFHRALEQLAERCAVVALISGRSAPAIRQMIDVPGVEVFGIHGLQRVVDGRDVLAPGVEQWRQPVENVALELTALARRFGVDIETKEISVVINWRLLGEPVPELLSSIMDIASSHGLAVLPARKSIEVHPPLKLDKGSCLITLAQEHDLRGLVYLGDDHSDLAAFMAIRQMREQGRLDGLAFGVLSAEMPEGLVASADLVMDGVADVEEFFAWLCERA
jgi:trehalose 6-phosphate phosphatase